MKRAERNESLTKLLAFAFEKGGWVKQSDARYGAGLHAAQGSLVFKRLIKGDLGEFRGKVEYEVKEQYTCPKKRGKAKYLKVTSLTLPEDPELVARRILEINPTITLARLVELSGCKNKRAPIIRREVLGVNKVDRSSAKPAEISKVEQKEYAEAKRMRALWPTKK